MEALLVETVSRHIPTDAIAKATRFYESEAGQVILAFLVDPGASQPTREQLMRYEEYRASNPDLEGPQGKAMIGAAIEGYFEHLFE